MKQKSPQQKYPCAHVLGNGKSVVVLMAVAVVYIAASLFYFSHLFIHITNKLHGNNLFILYEECANNDCSQRDGTKVRKEERERERIRKRSGGKTPKTNKTNQQFIFILLFLCTFRSRQQELRKKNHRRRTT